jgi:hypothetical protein
MTEGEKRVREWLAEIRRRGEFSIAKSCDKTSVGAALALRAPP